MGHDTRDLEDRQQQRDGDGADNRTQDRNHQGLDDGHHAANRRFELLLVEERDLVADLAEFAALLARAEHLDDTGRNEISIFGHQYGFGELVSVLDLLIDLGPELLEVVVVDASFDDADRVEQPHTRIDHGCHDTHAARHDHIGEQACVF